MQLLVKLISSIYWGDHMINILIIEDDFFQLQNLANYVSSQISNVKIYNLLSNGEDALDILLSNKIDVILLDLKLPKMSGIDIINFISEHKIEKYKQSIIIITGELNLLNQIISNPYVFTYVCKGNGLPPVVAAINNWINSISENQKIIDIKHKIIKILNYLDYNFSHLGTQYLCDVIYELYTRKETLSINLTKNIYPLIATKYKTSINNIKTNITQSCISMYYNCEEQKLKNFFGYNVIEKPTVKEIIVTILNKI